MTQSIYAPTFSLDQSFTLAIAAVDLSKVLSIISSQAFLKYSELAAWSRWHTACEVVIATSFKCI